MVLVKSVYHIGYFFVGDVDLKGLQHIPDVIKCHVSVLVRVHKIKRISRVKVGSSVERLSNIFQLFFCVKVLLPNTNKGFTGLLVEYLVTAVVRRPLCQK